MKHTSELRLFIEATMIIGTTPVYRYLIREANFENDKFVFTSHILYRKLIDIEPIFEQNNKEAEHYVKNKIRDQIKSARELLNLYEEALNKPSIIRDIDL